MGTANGHALRACSQAGLAVRKAAQVTEFLAAALGYPSGLPTLPAGEAARAACEVGVHLWHAGGASWSALTGAVAAVVSRAKVKA